MGFRVCRVDQGIGNENNYFTEMCSGSEAGSYLRLIDFVYHSTPGSRAIGKRSSMPVRAASGGHHRRPFVGYLRCVLGAIGARLSTFGREAPRLPERSLKTDF